MQSSFFSTGQMFFSSMFSREYDPPREYPTNPEPIPVIPLPTMEQTRAFSVGALQLLRQGYGYSEAEIQELAQSDREMVDTLLAPLQAGSDAAAWMTANGELLRAAIEDVREKRAASARENSLAMSSFESVEYEEETYAERMAFHMQDIRNMSPISAKTAAKVTAVAGTAYVTGGLSAATGLGAYLFSDHLDERSRDSMFAAAVALGLGADAGAAAVVSMTAHDLKRDLLQWFNDIDLVEAIMVRHLARSFEELEVSADPAPLQEDPSYVQKRKMELGMQMNRLRAETIDPTARQAVEAAGSAVAGYATGTVGGAITGMALGHEKLKAALGSAMVTRASGSLAVGAAHGVASGVAPEATAAATQGFFSRAASAVWSSAKALGSHAWTWYAGESTA